jgi:hypothetical protein
MLTVEEWCAWCQRLRLSQDTEALIATIRSSPPVRKVQGQAGNVSGRYPSPKMRWCPSIAWMKGRRSDVDRSLVEPGVKVTWHAVAQQCFHGPHRVRHPCCHARRDGCHCLGDPAC